MIRYLLPVGSGLPLVTSRFRIWIVPRICSGSSSSRLPSITNEMSTTRAFAYPPQSRTTPAAICELPMSMSISR